MVNMLAIIVICTKFAAKLVKKRSYHPGNIQSKPENICLKNMFLYFTNFFVIDDLLTGP